MQLVAVPFRGGFEVMPLGAPDTDATARRLRREALDAVAEFRRVVDAADASLEGQGAANLSGRALTMLKREFQDAVDRAASAVFEAIKVAHVATGATPDNHHVIDDAGDVIYACWADEPFDGERTFFCWPFVVIQTSKAIQPRRPGNNR